METRKEKHSKKGSPGKTGKRRWWKTKQFKWTLGIVIVLLLAVIGFYAYSIGHFVTGIQESKDKGDTPVKVEEWTGTEPVNIVLLGVDNRDSKDQNPRSDSILVVSIDPQTKKAHVMSVMRDTWYKIPGYGFEKINAAHALGGPDLTIQTLKDFLQIPIHYYVKTDFQGFIKIVDALGGVDIDVEKDLNYADDGVYDIHLKKGMQHLDGEHALMYVRFRHDAMSDFARTERQRKFLAAVSEQMSSPLALAKLPSILSDIEPYIKTNMTASDMVKLGKLALSISKSDIQTMQVPPMDALKEGMAGGGQSVLIPNVSQTRKEVYQYLGLDETKLPADTSEQQPQEYYQPEPVVPQNPKVTPDTPEPPKVPTTPEDGKTGTGGVTDPFKNGTGGTTTPGTGTTTPGTGGTGTGGTTTPGTGGTGTGGTTQPGTGGTGTGGATKPGTGSTDTGTGGTTKPGTGGTTTPGTGGTTGGTGTTGGGTAPTGGQPSTGTGTTPVTPPAAPAPKAS